MNPLATAWLKALGGILAAALLLAYLHGSRRRVRERLRAWSAGPPLSLRGRELLPRGPFGRVLAALGELGFGVAALGVVFSASFYALGRFEASAPVAQRLLDHALEPITLAGKAVLGYLPKAFFILVFSALLYLALQVIRLVFDRIASRSISFEGFPSDWALPTYKIVRFLVLAFGAVVIWPYLPGSDSDAFKGISLFVGVLISLSSSSALGNLIAGVILTYTRAFHPGDRIRAAGCEGTVIDKTLLVTRLRDVRNVVVTLPNAKLLSEPIQNLGGTAGAAPLMLTASVTIGYDTHWTQVHERLLASLKGQAHVLAEPPPKVWQRSLQDFYVHYELCFHTDAPGLLEATLSSVNASIQDRFAEAGMEIASPSLYARREAAAAILPKLP